MKDQDIFQDCGEKPLKSINAAVMIHVCALYSATESYIRYIEIKDPCLLGSRISDSFR